MYIVIKVSWSCKYGTVIRKKPHIATVRPSSKCYYTNQVELFSACCLESEFKKTFASTC